jgi:hypothetical protein
MCRSLYVLEYGAVASKPEAARWAIRSLGESWHSLISWAAMYPAGVVNNQLERTIGLILFTLEKWELPTGGKKI